MTIKQCWRLWSSLPSTMVSLNEEVPAQFILSVKKRMQSFALWFLGISG